MASLCLYFHVHQPVRLRRFSVFDIGTEAPYFDDARNEFYLRRAAEKCYRPMTALLLDLIRAYGKRFAVSFSLTGVFLEQAERWFPDVLQSFRKLAKTGRVEFLAETYHHSLASLYSRREFREQVKLHERKLFSLFQTKPRVFRNTELCASNEIARTAKRWGYRGLLAEGHGYLLEWRSPNFVYELKTAPNFPVLMRNYRLSDDISFRFSAPWWSERPLTAEKFASWVDAAAGNGPLVNLFMDFETFGEHQWPETGIFEFMRHLPAKLFQNPANHFVTVSEAIKKFKPVAALDMHYLTSWADIERDLSAWRGNKLQESALAELYALEKPVKAARDRKLLDDWRKLQTSDHFYYMCTKWFADGDVHKYFNPYESPYEAYITFMNIINDIKLRVGR